MRGGEGMTLLKKVDLSKFHSTSVHRLSQNESFVCLFDFHIAFSWFAHYEFLPYTKTYWRAHGKKCFRLRQEEWNVQNNRRRSCQSLGISLASQFDGYSQKWRQTPQPVLRRSSDFSGLDHHCSSLRTWVSMKTQLLVYYVSLACFQVKSALS